MFFFFKVNVLGSMLWGLAVFFYNNFLQDLPSIYRRKAADSGVEGLPWYKRYVILLFAPFKQETLSKFSFFRFMVLLDI